MWKIMLQRLRHRPDHTGGIGLRRSGDLQGDLTSVYDHHGHICYMMSAKEKGKGGQGKVQGKVHVYGGETCVGRHGSVGHMGTKGLIATMLLAFTNVTERDNVGTLVEKTVQPNEGRPEISKENQGGATVRRIPPSWE